MLAKPPLHLRCDTRRMHTRHCLRAPSQSMTVPRNQRLDAWSIRRKRVVTFSRSVSAKLNGVSATLAEALSLRKAVVVRGEFLDSASRGAWATTNTRFTSPANQADARVWTRPRAPPQNNRRGSVGYAHTVTGSRPFPVACFFLLPYLVCA